MKQDNQKIRYFNYNRKSLADKERQVLSLSSQEEAMKEIAEHCNLQVVKTFREAKSAKEPNKRPIFLEMVGEIKKGKANGIICWELSRLARNPEEAGIIIGMLQRGEIQHIKTYNKDYYSGDNSVISFVEFGIANQFSRDLSRNVKRGIDKKASMGWRPTRAPLGYLNSKTKLKGEQDISSDPERFHLVKQTLNLMLTGNYTVPKLYEIMNDELCLRLPATRTRPSRKLQLSELYRILTNPFYYGWYKWDGEWILGKHEPMITEEEYDRIQFLLGRKGRPRPKTHKFAFTGLVRCGSCGAMVTAEEKFKKQKNGNVHHYIYYHCTKKINRDCTEKAVELKEFNRQVDEIIESITISEKFKNWAIKYLHEIRKTEAKANESALDAKQKALFKITNDLDNLVLRYTSSENANGELITTQEYQSLKGRLMKEKTTLEVGVNNQSKEINDWVELTERTFNFARYARVWFAQGDMDTKRAIFACLGSHPVLMLQELKLPLKKPLNSIFEKRELAEKEYERLEPLKIPINSSTIGEITKKFPVMSG